MGRITKEIGNNLIKFVKKIEVRADMLDPKSGRLNTPFSLDRYRLILDILGTAFEFTRQMMSKNLQKLNPDFKCNFVYVKNEPAVVTAEYSNGKSWTQNISGYKINQLRTEFFEGAYEAEDQFDMENDAPDEMETKSSKKADAKGGKK